MDWLGIDLAALLPFIAVGFAAQLVDGALGMAFGVITNTLLVGLLGISPAQASQKVHVVECFTTATSGLIDHSGADLWITAARVPYIEQGVPFSERKLSTVLSTPGVAAAAKYIVRFTQWQRPDGRQESVQVVGFDPDRTLGGP